MMTLNDIFERVTVFHFPLVLYFPLLKEISEQDAFHQLQTEKFVRKNCVFQISVAFRVSNFLLALQVGEKCRFGFSKWRFVLSRSPRRLLEKFSNTITSFLRNLRDILNSRSEPQQNPFLMFSVVECQTELKRQRFEKNASRKITEEVRRMELLRQENRACHPKVCRLMMNRRYSCLAEEC